MRRPVTREDIYNFLSGFRKLRIFHQDCDGEIHPRKDSVVYCDRCCYDWDTLKLAHSFTKYDKMLMNFYLFDPSDGQDHIIRYNQKEGYHYLEPVVKDDADDFDPFSFDFSDPFGQP